MKTTLGRRWLALFLTLALCLTLAPAVFADGPLSVTLSPSALTVVAGNSKELTASVTNAPEGGVTYTWDRSNTSVEVTPQTDAQKATVRGASAGSATVTVTVMANDGSGATATATARVTVEEQRSVTVTPNEEVIMDVGDYLEFKATPTPSGERVTWESKDPSVVEVQSTTSTVNNVYGRSPGETQITATIGSGENMASSLPVNVAVSGLVLDSEDRTMSLVENKTKPLPIAKAYGNAANGRVVWQSSNPSVAQISGNSVAGRGPGSATITGFVGGNYQVSFTVTVTADEDVTIVAADIESGGRMDFSSYLSQLNNQAENGLSHLTGIYVSPDQGTLYYQYSSPNEPNAGVAQRDNYYYNPGSGQRGLRDITFIPNPDYSGQVTIQYTGVSNTNQVYNGRILLNIKQTVDATISLSATNREPARFDSDSFNRVCQQKTGAELDYVVFSLPAAGRGTLYADYVNADNYGSLVTPTAQYRRGDLDGIVFIPGPGVTGKVTVYYTARARGSSGGSYSGQVIITVSRDDIAGTGGPVYNISKGATQLFNGDDFDDYCSQLIYGGRLGYVQFTSLPSSSQGALYHNYRTSNSTGTPVRTDTAYYYGSRNPRLDRITFVPAEDFTGTVRIPFNGWDEDGNRFTGNVEINVQGTGGTGNIRYSCAPGRTVDFAERDFVDLCDELTGRTLNYIIFQDLPDRSNQGSLYLNNTRINSAGTRYNRGSGSNRIRDLSFRAVSSFSGWVDIPFIGYSTGSTPVTFNGVITIDATSGGSGYTTITYYTDTNTAAVFSRDDFNDVSWDETGYGISSVRFTIPSSNRGDLYRNYRSSTNRGTRISSNSSVSASGLDQVAFIPANGFVGTVYIDYTATATGSGGTFNGTIEIEVERPGAAATARYSTRTSPVSFQSEDFRRSGYTLSSIRLNELPAASEGKLYYNYTSPTQYDRLAATNTSYRAGSSGSNLISDLTFVPKAGFTGTVTLSYTGTNSNNSTFDGEVIITVSPTTSSSRFNDLDGYSDQQRAAVEYIYNNGVTVGISEDRYGPELSITRGDFALMVYNAFNFTPSSNSWVFNDVPPNVYYAQAVNALYARGIVSGVGNGDYAPTSNVAREDAICMVQRAMRAVGWTANDGSYSTLSGYNDASSVSGYAQGAMSMAVQQGLLPVNGRNLSPRQALTRIDMAQILHRVLTR